MTNMVLCLLLSRVGIILNLVNTLKMITNPKVQDPNGLFNNILYWLSLFVAEVFVFFKCMSLLFSNGLYIPYAFFLQCGFTSVFSNLPYYIFSLSFSSLSLSLNFLILCFPQLRMYFLFLSLWMSCFDPALSGIDTAQDSLLPEANDKLIFCTLLHVKANPSESSFDADNETTSFPAS